jgi:hypothetical protein
MNRDPDSMEDGLRILFIVGAVAVVLAIVVGVVVGKWLL